MASTIIILLAVWVGMNAAFVAIRLYIAAGRGAGGEPGSVGYPRLVN